MTSERFCLDVERHAWILLHQSIDDGPDQTRRNRIRASDPQLSCGRIGQKTYLADALLQLVENRDAAFDESATVLSWFDTLRTAVEEADAEIKLHVGNCLGNGGL